MTSRARDVLHGAGPLRARPLGGASVWAAWLWVGLLALALPGCGGEDERAPAPQAVERTSWQGLLRGVLSALEARDYGALHGLLSPVGRQALDADLRQFCAMVGDPQQGPRLMSKVRARWPGVPAALVESARAGDLRAAWELFMTAATPAGVPPRQAGLKVDPARPDEATVFYRYGEGPEQPIELKRVKGLWSVEHVGLGGR